MIDADPPACLYVDVKWPRPDRDAASQRALQLIGELVHVGFDVDVAVIDAIDEDGRDAPADLAGGHPVSGSGVDAVLAHVAARTSSYRVAVLAWTRVAQALLGSIRSASPATTIVFDTVDVNHVREFRHARVTGNANLLRRAMAMKAAELSAVEAADRTIAVTEVDAATLESASGRSVDVVTLAVAERTSPVPGPRSRSGLLFLGNVHAWHNVDAILHLATAILPGARAARPGLTLAIVGAGYAEPIAALDGPGVIKLGAVADLEPVFDQARVFACPLRIGSGVKGKVLTALALGLPVVTTPIGAEGMGITDGHDGLIAETAEAFVAAIVRLDTDDALWHRLSANGQALVRARFTRAVVARQVRQIFEPLVEARSTPETVAVAAGGH